MLFQGYRHEPVALVDKFYIVRVLPEVFLSRGRFCLITDGLILWQITVTNLALRWVALFRDATLGVVCFACQQQCYTILWVFLSLPTEIF